MIVKGRLRVGDEVVSLISGVPQPGDLGVVVKTPTGKAIVVWDDGNIDEFTRNGHPLRETIEYLSVRGTGKFRGRAVAKTRALDVDG